MGQWARRITGMEPPQMPRYLVECTGLAPLRACPADRINTWGETPDPDPRPWNDGTARVREYGLDLWSGRFVRAMMDAAPLVETPLPASNIHDCVGAAFVPRTTEYTTAGDPVDTTDRPTTCPALPPTQTMRTWSTVVTFNVGGEYDPDPTTILAAMHAAAARGLDNGDGTYATFRIAWAGMEPGDVF